MADEDQAEEAAEEELAEEAPQDGDGGQRAARLSPPVVAIGASAGGLEALKELLGSVSDDTGACFVIVQHLDPEHKSMLTELLGRCTRMPVEHAQDGTQVAPNRVFVISPNSTLTLRDGAFKVEKPAPPRLHRTPIDTLFRSLATDQGERAIAIVLSGTGSDGTQGLKEVKEAGGFTLVQDPETAKNASMPRSAEATGLVDDVLAPRDMPQRLSEYLEHLEQEAKLGGKAEPRDDLRSQLATICSILKNATGHDFRQYKEPTLVRRVQRRLQVLRLAEVDDYIQRLREDRKEARELFRELLVSVTGFFRDPEAFDALESRVLKPLIEEKGADDTVRIWVPGCATGEEAYSLAIVARDYIESSGRPIRIQVFATDIDEKALEIARRGVYPEGIVNNVPDRYLKRFFRARGAEYEVIQEIRELCIFSVQSLIKDPPFNKLDLISCRNVLIYLRPELQNRLIPVFHYALRPGGHLFLGTSENVTRHARLFETRDKKWRIFRRRETQDRPQLHFPLSNLAAETPEQRGQTREQKPQQGRRDGIAERAERAILDDLGPAYAVIGDQRELVFTGGRVEPYLRVPRGSASFEIFGMLREDLRMDVRALLHRAMTQGEESVRERVSIDTEQGRRLLRIVCRPLGEDRESANRFLLVFQDYGLARLPESESEGLSEGDDGRVEALESELRATKEYLQTTTEELESSNEELKSANEELMSMNEELQSSNEELETSKEELQSINEELETVNAELSNKVDELGRSNADLENLLESTRIATLFLDRGLKVRKFTPVAQEIFHLIENDLGRPIEDINTRLVGVDLAADARRVLDKLTPVEREVSLRDGKATYLMRLLPYRTAEDVIDGAVATFFDVTTMHEARERIAGLNADLENKVADLQAVLDLAPIGIAFADNPECDPIQINERGAKLAGTGRSSVPADNPNSGYSVQRDGKTVATAELPLQKCWRTGKPVSDFRATIVRADGTRFEMLMSAAPIRDAEGAVRRVVGVYDDVTDLVEAQGKAERRAAQQEFVAALGASSLKNVESREIVDTLPGRLAAIMEVDCAKVLLLRTDGAFDLAATTGFDAEAGTVVPGGVDSQAGFTLQTNGPVVVEDMAREQRFQGPALLTDNGIVSGISVPIGDPANAWGVLGVHATWQRTFTLDEVQFVQAAANVVAASLARDAWAERQGLLLRELRHRVKNVLATVQAIGRLSFRNTKTPETDNFLERIQALAEAHDLTFRSDWRAVDFADLVERQVGPFHARGSVTVEGPRGTSISPLVAIDVSILLHELITNAGKHGALSHNDGSLSISWRPETQDGTPLVVLHWRERGVPGTSEPTHAGVGTRMMQTLTKGADCRIDRQWHEDGLELTLRIVASDPAASA